MSEVSAANYIAGQWIDAIRPTPVLSPRDSTKLGVIDRADSQLANKAVDAAAHAFADWRRRPIESRCQILSTFADLLVREYGEEGKPSPLKDLISNEMGKPLPEADIEVIETSDMVRYFADNAPSLLQQQPIHIASELWASKSSEIHFEPRGVIAVIKPWNYPLELPLWSIAPALAAGNTIVFKPSELSSLVGLRIAELFEEADLPPGVLNIVTGGAEAGRALVTNSAVSMISFTGSKDTGIEVSRLAGERLVSANMELGGVDAAIVLDDANLELASNGVVWGATCNSGQVCVGTKRVFVHDAIFDDFAQLVIRKTKALRKGIDYGPIVSAKQIDKIETQLNHALDEGATLACGGNRNEPGQLYFEPTVLLDVDITMEIVQEECFGPVVPLIRYSGDDKEVVDLANRSNYGLGASVWTDNLERGKTIASDLNVGMVWVNDVNVAFAEAPWGGRRWSGNGIELSKFGLHEYVLIKHINVEQSRSDRRDWWYPYGS